MEHDINTLSKTIEERMRKHGLLISHKDTSRVFTLAEVSFALPKYLEDEKGNIYQFNMAQAVSWTQDNSNSFLPFYKLYRGKERRYKYGGSNQGYLNANQNCPGHWLSGTEYNAKASLLCWLIERGYMNKEDVFNRLKNGTEKKDFNALKKGR